MEFYNNQNRPDFVFDNGPIVYIPPTTPAPDLSSLIRLLGEWSRCQMRFVREYIQE